MIASKKNTLSKFVIQLVLPLLAINMFSCIKDIGYEEVAIGRPGTSKFIYRWHSSYISDQTTGVTDTIFPTSESDQITIEEYDRFKVFVGTELVLDLDIIGGGSIDNYQDERLCDQTIGGQFLLLSGGNKVYYKFEEDGSYFRFWQIPFIDGTTYDSPNLFGMDKQCKSYSRFTYEIIHY
jgi:hypothetical protein